MCNSILIIGAGLGGLALAQGLKKNNIPIKVYERDAQKDFRAQGYRLRIGTEGILALRTTLTPELFGLFEATCAENGSLSGGARLDALSGKPLAQNVRGEGPPIQAHGPLEPYTVDRGVLREVLMTDLQEELHFRKRFTHYETTEKTVVAFFDDGTSEEGALLVGADGLRSQVRKQLLGPSYPYLDTGMRIVYGKTYITTEFEEKFAREALDGMTLITERETRSPKTLLLEAIRFPRTNSVRGIQLPRDYVYWVLLAHKDYILLRDDEALRLDGEGSARLSLELTVKWDASVRVLIEEQDRDQTSTLRVCSVRPDIPAWEANARVTLLGDAIHAMPPTGGMGVNTALRDAEDLVRKIIQVGGPIDMSVNVVAQYEESLREFARKSVRLSWEGGQRGFDLRSAETCEEISL
ncbi:FAD-dependent oxidoreductase [Aspergillus saccharolyticus JOP 1030-1]|uniref:Cercosporin toxin biosynthesis protein n=1 Tax=Aspergillus saccharolyticus JOP 1030-1 TaxID=1450539 RepID=A0A318Z2Z7_9EURO|nr:cercosporin toxin biosynthesis protein [Aspergillus saccharolyticus JOP 1030-1]PYH40744.1 cercosporin toxin biosynthesis protein [Aspergillus saccharolyticus JOP 1030-1]